MRRLPACPTGRRGATDADRGPAAASPSPACDGGDLVARGGRLLPAWCLGGAGRWPGRPRRRQRAGTLLSWPWLLQARPGSATKAPGSAGGIAVARSTAARCRLAIPPVLLQDRSCPPCLRHRPRHLARRPARPHRRNHWLQAGGILQQRRRAAAGRLRQADRAAHHLHLRTALRGRAPRQGTGQPRSCPAASPEGTPGPMAPPTMTWSCQPRPRPRPSGSRHGAVWQGLARRTTWKTPNNRHGPSPRR